MRLPEFESNTSWMAVSVSWPGVDLLQEYQKSQGAKLKLSEMGTMPRSQCAQYMSPAKLVMRVEGSERDCRGPIC